MPSPAEVREDPGPYRGPIAGIERIEPRVDRRKVITDCGIDGGVESYQTGGAVRRLKPSEILPSARGYCRPSSPISNRSLSRGIRYASSLGGCWQPAVACGPTR
jgi:hypothetical protein